MNQTVRRTLAGLILPASLLLCAAPALAASVTITNDGGAAVPLTAGLTQRNMHPEVGFTFAADEKRYAVQILGPGGQSASLGQSCINAAYASPERVHYQGNGTYTVVLKVSKNADDTDCAQATEQRIAFTINAFTRVLAPASTVLLTRLPGDYSYINYDVPVDLNPGADTHELRYAAGAAIGPDGGISGPSDQGYVDSATGKAHISFTKPGHYTFVARAKAFTSAGDVATAWSAPLNVTVLAPFDLSTTSFPDSRGPTYKVAGQTREPSATGKVTLAVAKGKTGKKFKTLGSGKLHGDGKFSVRFRLKKFGTYTLRFTYKGGPTVAAGTSKQVIRISKRIFF